MLQLQSNGKLLDFKKVSFNLTLKNPIFSTNKSEGSYVFNLTLPGSKRNKAILEAINPIHNPNAGPSESDFKILFNGIPIGGNSSAKLVKYHDDLVLNIFVGNGNFNYQAKDKYLNEVELGSKIFASDTEALLYFNFCVANKYPSSEFAMPHIAEQTHSYLPEGTSGYHHKDTLNYWDPAFPTYRPLISGDKGIFTPMPYLPLILKNLYKSFGYTVKDQFFANDAELNNLIIFNTYNINGGIPSHDDKPGYFSDMKNVIYNNHVPQVEISNFNNGLRNFLNMAMFINSDRKEVLFKGVDDILVDPEYIEFSDKILSSSQLSFEQNDGFHIKSNYDQGDSFFKIKVETAEYFMNRFGGTLDYISDLPGSPGRFIYYYIREDHNFYWYVAGAWVIDNSYANTLVLTDYLKGNKALKLESDFSTLYNDTLIGYYAITAGNAAIEYTDITPRLLFYLGRTDVGGGIYYPQAHYETANRSLFWYENNGLFEKNWKHFIKWKQQSMKIVKYKKQISAAALSNLDFSKKYRIDGANYLIKEVKVPITEDTILPATLECVKV